MRSGITWGFACAWLAFASADKKLPLEQSSNEQVEISASLILDKEEVKRELGSELNGIVVVRMRVRPLTDKPVKIDRDDFFLLQTYDGQRSTPYAPTQIAGNSTLVVGSQGTRGSMSSAGNGPDLGWPGWRTAPKAARQRRRHRAHQRSGIGHVHGQER